MTETSEEPRLLDRISPSQQNWRYGKHANANMTCVILLLSIVGTTLVIVGWQGLPRAERLEKGSLVVSEASKQLSNIAQSTGESSTISHYSNNSSVPSSTLPRLVWLMSFPNSGTSYTLRMVAAETNRAIATNYGEEFTDGSYANIPVYPLEDGVPPEPEGPFWRGHYEEKSLPDKYILTKTHCGGRCVRCGPRKYLLTQSQFLHTCTEGRGCFPDGDTHGAHPSCQWKYMHYPVPPKNPRIGKIIHLIRNPFDNIIARFHLARKLQLERLKNEPKALEKWMDQHPDNPEGFATWCKELDNEYGSPLDPESPDFLSIEHMLCIGEWFKYAQWHTLALGVKKLTGDELPSLTIYYEDYDRDWIGTTQIILDFLELSRDKDAKSHTFVSHPSPTNYYTLEHRREAKALVQKLTSEPVWELLKRYF
jgi:Sulfotransferase domain